MPETAKNGNPSPFEIRIAQLLSDGLTLPEISKKMGRSYTSIREWKRVMKRRLGLKTDAGLAVWYLKEKS